MSSRQSGSYLASQSHSTLDAELDRLKAQALFGWEKEVRNLRWCGLKDGMHLLEVGSGPGFVTAALLREFPSLHITSVEVDTSLVERATQYLADKGGERVTHVLASVMETRLPDDSFDFAYARYLFQHLPDPAGAAMELRRVLKPGGVVAIHDIDDGVWGVTDPPLSEANVLLERVARCQASRGGNRHIGRSLWGILQAAPFVGINIEAIVSHSREHGIEPFLAQLDPGRLSPLIAAGVVTRAEHEQFSAALQKFLGAPDPSLMSLTLVCSGRKPGTTGVD